MIPVVVHHSGQIKSSPPLVEPRYFTSAHDYFPIRKEIRMLLYLKNRGRSRIGRITGRLARLWSECLRSAITRMWTTLYEIFYNSIEGFECVLTLRGSRHGCCLQIGIYNASKGVWRGKNRALVSEIIYWTRGCRIRLRKSKWICAIKASFQENFISRDHLWIGTPRHATSTFM